VKDATIKLLTPTALDAEVAGDLSGTLKDGGTRRGRDSSRERHEVNRNVTTASMRRLKRNGLKNVRSQKDSLERLKP
jgi:hypothetical protein